MSGFLTPPPTPREVVRFKPLPSLAHTEPQAVGFELGGGPGLGSEQAEAAGLAVLVPGGPGVGVKKSRDFALRLSAAGAPQI